MFVRSDAKIFRFCRSKCHRHFKAKHNPRKFKWTRAYRKTAGKELAVDATFEFEQKRNTPVRYDRDLYVKTIRAMKRVEEIKKARKERFYMERMLTAAARSEQKDLNELKKNEKLLEREEKLQQAERERRQKDHKKITEGTDRQKEIQVEEEEASLESEEAELESESEEEEVEMEELSMLKTKQKTGKLVQRI